MVLISSTGSDSMPNETKMMAVYQKLIQHEVSSGNGAPWVSPERPLLGLLEGLVARENYNQDCWSHVAVKMFFFPNVVMRSENTTAFVHRGRQNHDKVS